MLSLFWLLVLIFGIVVAEPTVFAHFFSYDDSITRTDIRFFLRTIQVLFFVTLIISARLRKLYPFRFKDRLQKFTLVALSICFSLGIAELTVRIWFPQYNGIPNQNLLFEPDSLFGWKFIPNLNTIVTIPFESKTTIVTNEQGYRDESFDSNNSAIAFLGDSFVASIEVDEHERFTEIIETQLDTIQTWNFGINGYGPTQSLLALKYDVLPRKPLMVVYMLYIRNDFFDVTGALDWIHNLSRPMIEVKNDTIAWLPYVYNDNLDSLSLEESWLYNNKKPIRPENFHLYNLVQRLTIPKDDRRIEPPEIHLLSVVKEDPQVIEGIVKTKAIIKEMKRLCDNEKIPFILALAPSFVQIKETFWVDALQHHNLDANDYNLLRINNLMSDFTMSNSILYLDLYSSLRAGEMEGLNTYFLKNQHWTKEGHRIVAEQLIKIIKEHL